MALPNSEKITSQIAMLPDQALKQMAMMHKNDPYVLPLIISEDGRRKQMRQAAQAQMAGMPQPKVADAALAQMGQLPEDQGIAQIPAPNMQRMADGGIAGYGDDQEGMAQGGMFDFSQRSEPVLRMAGGGVPGYKKGDAIKVYEDRIRAEAARQGVNPDLAVRMFTQESRGDKNAVSPKGAAGLGQLMIPAAKEMGLSPAERFDPEKNIIASVGYLKKQLVKYEGDPEKALAAYNWGGGNVDKHLAKNEGRLNRVGLPKETADYLTKILPIGSARAGELPSKDLASQIPGQRSPAPASTYDQQNSYFGRLADTMGIPQEYQRNIANTANALSGFTSPISTVNRAVGTTSKALEATPEMIAKAQQAKQVAETQRLLPPAKAGLEALDDASQATRAAAEAARRARGVEQDVQAAKAAEQSIDAANLTSKIARTTEEAVAAGPNARALDSAKLANASRALATAAPVEATINDLFAGNKAPESNGTENQSAAETARLLRQNELAETAPKPSDLIAAAKEATPTKERKGFGNDDLLMLGLSLLASKSPNFMTALGEAGIQTLGAKKEREKAETDLEYKDIMKKYYGALGTKAEADAKNLEAGTKYNAQARQQATENIAREMQKWYSTLGGMNPTQQEEEAKRNSLVRQYFPLAGLEVPSTISAPAPSAGFKVLGSRPQ
jgi:hypothetical protein